MQKKTIRNVGHLYYSLVSLYESCKFEGCEVCGLRKECEVR